MKFSIKTKELANAINIVSKAVAKNTALPILETVLITATKDGIMLRATDLEVELQTFVKCDVSIKGSITLTPNAKDMLSLLKDDVIEITSEKQLTVFACKTGKYKFPSENPADFPTIGELTDADAIVLGADELIDIWSDTSKCVSSDDLRPAMTGVYFDFKNGVICATDAHKLVKIEKKFSAQIDNGIIIPQKAMRFASSVFAKDADVKVSFSNSFVFFTSQDTIVRSKLIDARYPQFDAVIPENLKTYFTISKSAILNTLKRVGIFANTTTHLVVLEIAKNKLTISTANLEYGQEASETISCVTDGKEMKIGVNTKFFSEMIGLVNGDFAKVYYDSPTRALVIQEEQFDGKTILTMPIGLTE